MMCKFLNFIFKTGVRPIQSLSIVMSLAWLAVLWFDRFEFIQASLPTAIEATQTDLAWWFLITLLTTFVSFCLHSRARQTVKSFALIMSAGAQAIVANGFVSKYPPFDMMLFVSTSLSIVFLLAVLYVVKCEGIDGADHS